MNQQKQKTDFHVVGVGASAGGLDALEKLFSNAPANNGLAFVVIQHLSPDYKSLMADLLAKRTAMPVQVAKDGIAIQPNHVYLIPPKKNMTIFHHKLYLTERESEQLHLPIDIFFRSLADDVGEKAIGIILSGTGSDGTRGLRAIKEQGGIVIVQDERTAKFDGMPRSAISTNLVDYILAPEHMVREMLNYVQHPCLVSDPTLKKAIAQDEDNLSKIFALLRDQSGVDFTYYKQSTMIRRIERRMGIKQIEKLSDYLHYLYQSPTEVNTLYRELLIGVTRFFRDPEAFEEIKTNVIPAIFESKNRGEPIRVWVAGCSTGEEAYSLAILMTEYMEVMGHHMDVKVFATDLDKNALEFAGKGIYPESIAADVSPERLTTYFVKSGDSYTVARRVRERVIFAQQNLITDPPFSKVDLISCRNVLIYLQPILQKKVLSAFQFALNPDGFLFLGTSETVGDLGDFFLCRHTKWKLYQYKGGFRPTLDDARLVHLPTPSATTKTETYSAPLWNNRHVVESIQRGVMEAFLSPTIVVDENQNIVYVSGDLDNYLRIPTDGLFTANVLKRAREGLSIPLSTAIHKVFKDHEEVVYKNIHLSSPDLVQTIDLVAKPFIEPTTRQKLALIHFPPISHPVTQAPDVESFDLDRNAQQRIQDLEHELQHTRESLQATVEELETSNEELQATNEELFAANEELQSTNEELHSVNEELVTVNAEYHAKIQELINLNEDMDNLLRSTDVGTVFLDRELRVRRFTPAAQQEINLLDQDVGRPLSHISHNIIGCDLVHEAQKVLKTLTTQELEVQNKRGRWYQMRLLPYYTLEKQIGGVVITFVDITAFKEANARLTRLTAAIEQSTQLKMILDLGGHIEYANPKVLEATDYLPEELIGHPWPILLAEDTNPAALQATQRALREGKTWRGELRYRAKGGTTFWCTVTISPIKNAQEEYIAALCAAEDITARKEAQAQIEWEARLQKALTALYVPLTSSESSIEDITKIVLNQARTLTDSQHGYVSIIDPETKNNISYTLTEMLPDACGVSKENQTIVFPPDKDGHYPALWGHALNTREAFYTNAPAEHPASKGLPEGHITLDQFLSMPVMLEDELVGHIALANAPYDYDENDMDAIQRLAEFYALAIQRKRAEEAQTQLEAQLQSERDFIAAILNTTGALIVVLDHEGRIVRFNAACEHTTGYTAAEVEGQYLRDLFLIPEEVDAVQATFQELCAGNFPNTHANYWSTRDGEQRWITWSNTAIVNQDGNVKYIIGSGIDLTEYQETDTST